MHAKPESLSSRLQLLAEFPPLESLKILFERRYQSADTACSLAKVRLNSAVRSTLGQWNSNCQSDSRGATRCRPLRKSEIV